MWLKCRHKALLRLQPINPTGLSPVFQRFLCPKCQQPLTVEFVTEPDAHGVAHWKAIRVTEVHHRNALLKAS